MPTAFRTTAILSDGTGFRTSVILASRLYGDWSEASKKEHCERERLPTKALDLTDAEYEAYEADPASRHGYVAVSGDVDSPFEPKPWVLMY